MTPEERARQEIDRQLQACGWAVQDYKELNLGASRGIAVREFPLKTGEADYLHYADAQAIGVVEAKPEGHTLAGVEPQSGKYAEGLTPGLPAHKLPLPFAYESTGSETRFTNILEPDARSRLVFTFHRPEELIRQVQLDDQFRGLLRQMPPPDEGRLWRVQSDAIRSLEKSLAGNRPRSLIQMATGSGKTYTAVNFCYRLIKHAKARHILFLHAEDVVRIAREEFGKGNDFCQKITAKAHKPDELLQQFRTAYNPRIAVTVDMIATGTDVKPLECLVFLRNIRSLSYVEQIKGRGCRVVDADTLQTVTPDARHKDHFVIVDAVGVCEEENSITKPLDPKPSVPLEKLLNLVGAGAADADIVSTLAARLARLKRTSTPIGNHGLHD